MLSPIFTVFSTANAAPATLQPLIMPLLLNVIFNGPFAINNDVAGFSALYNVCTTLGVIFK